MAGEAINRAAGREPKSPIGNAERDPILDGRPAASQIRSDRIRDEFPGP
jgi:hypothetical protein